MTGRRSEETRTALYRLYDSEGRLLYVGITSAPEVRWASHAAEKVWWRHVVTREIEWFASRDEAERAEVEAIVTEGPLHNQQHNPPGREAKRNEARSVIYTARARRSGSWWALDVPELPNVHSQAKRLDRAEREVAEAIAVLLDVELEQVGIRLEVEMTLEERSAIEAAEKAKHDRITAEEEARKALRAAARACTQAGLSYRDTGYLLGISFQRVSQVLE